MEVLWGKCYTDCVLQKYIIIAKRIEPLSYYAARPVKRIP